MEFLNFTVDSALLSELGEKLVRTVYVALAELVKNSYDADSTNVHVKFIEGKKGISEIHISDNGSGMNFHEVENYWMKIATTNKAVDNVSSKYGRPRTGSKGIGRFCCRRLGRSLTLVSVGKSGNDYQRTEVNFPWDEFKPGTNVTSIDCQGTKTTTKRSDTGTTLIIRNILDEWNNRNYNTLRRELAILVSNRGKKRKGYEEDPGFNIFIDAPQFEGGIKNLREDFINAGWGTIIANINKDHQAVCELNALGLDRKKKIISNQIFPHLNDISLKIGLLVDDKSQLRNTSVLSIGRLRNDILPYWGGVQIRYKGFRVYPYGDDDWLDIDKDRGLRKTAAPKEQLFTFAESLQGVNPRRALLNMLSMRNYVGDVDIGPNALGFEMKSNREGFIESDSVKELKEFVRFAIDWANIFREYYLRAKKREESEVAKQQFEEIFEDKIEAGKIVEISTIYILQKAKDISAHLSTDLKKEFIESIDKASSAIIAHDKSNQEELRHLRLVASTSTLLLIFSHEVRSLLGLLDQNQSALSTLEDKLTSPDNSILKDVRSELTETKTRFAELLNMTSLIGVDSRHAEPADLALRERIERAAKAFQLIIHRYDISLDYDDVPNNIVLKSILEAEIYAIFLNALSNSIKSVIAAGKNKKIKVTAERAKGKTRIRIMDTGIGIEPTYYDDVFIPFVADPGGLLYKNLSKRLNPEDKYIVGMGSGLGLSIVKEIVQFRNGSISFHSPEDGWNSELEIELP